MKRLLRVLAFVLVFMCIYAFLDDVLMVKTNDGSVPYNNFYALPKDTIDVLMLGSSHVGLNLDPAILYNDYGIAAYNMWSGMQPPWNSYYMLKEALQTQTPKVVMFEVYRCLETADYDEANSLKNVLGMRFGINKIRSALVSFKDWTKAAEAIWGLPNYHERYSELNQEDFNLRIDAEDVGLSQLTFDWTSVYPFTMIDYQSITDELPIGVKSETYLRKIIDLCEARGIELVLLAAPYGATEDEARRFNTLERIALEENIPMLNMLKNYQEYDIDPQTDFVEIAHMNTNGFPKMAKAIGDYLSANYDLPDRRLDEKHLWYGKQRELETETLAYEMNKVFRGDGMARYLDTGIKLYENRYDSWTIAAQVEKNAPDGSVYFSCYHDQDRYGIMVCKAENDTVSVRLSDSLHYEFAFKGEQMNIVINKNVNEYSVYINGKKAQDNIKSTTPSYAGTLLIGCQQHADDTGRFNHSTATVLDLNVYEDMLSENMIARWKPDALEEMPMPMGFGQETAEQIYTMKEQFLGGNSDYLQENHVDTGIKLYEEAATRFTLLTTIIPKPLAVENVYLSCFSEEPGAYRGLLVRRTQADAMNILLGANYGIQVPCKDEVPLYLAIVKDAATYTVYANGEKVLDQIELPCDAYSGNLLVGCQEDASGNKFRYSTTKVSGLHVFSGVMDEQEIMDWPYLSAKMPAKRTATSVYYTMNDMFQGDGTTDSYIDTGVKLYDVEEKDWTIAVSFVTDGLDGKVYLSCFSEDSTDYRGFMIRDGGEGKLSFFLGKETYTIDIPQRRQEMRFVVSKKGNVYTLCCDGSYLMQIQSSCKFYDGNLLVGCQELPDGTKFRHSAVRIMDLQVRDAGMDIDQAREFSIKPQSNGRFGQ